MLKDESEQKTWLEVAGSIKDCICTYDSCMGPAAVRVSLHPGPSYWGGEALCATHRHIAVSPSPPAPVTRARKRSAAAEVIR
jgi:hypothetical protein